MRPTDPIKVEVTTSDPWPGRTSSSTSRTSFTKRYERAGSHRCDAQFAFLVDPGRWGSANERLEGFAGAGRSDVWSSWIQGTPDGALLLRRSQSATDTRFADPPEVRAALGGPAPVRATEVRVRARRGAWGRNINADDIRPHGAPNVMDGEAALHKYSDVPLIVGQAPPAARTCCEIPRLSDEFGPERFDRRPIQLNTTFRLRRECRAAAAAG